MLRDIGSSTPVADMAMRQPVCVPRDTTILCASRIMRSFHVAELVVTEEPHGLPIPMGIVSACDIVTRIIAPGLDPGVFTAGDIAWASAVHTKVSDSLSHTLQLLQTAGTSVLPVIDDDGGLAGVISLSDVLIALGKA